MSMMIHRNLKERRKMAERNSTISPNMQQEVEEKEQLPFELTQYTRTDINRMNKDDLVSLANEVGIENAEETSGSELKRLLIDKFGL